MQNSFYEFSIKNNFPRITSLPRTPEPRISRFFRQRDDLTEGGGYRSPDTCRSRQIDTVTYRLANNTETLVGRGDIHRNP